jgi:hypothetical protein
MREPWTVDSVALRFSDAVETARRLPAVRVQGYLSRWPDIVREPWEAMAADDERPLRFPPSPQAIERMLQTMRWVQWLDEVETRHLVWMRARRYAWHQIGKRFGCDRVTAWRRWQAAMQLIADRLNEQLVPA